MTRLLLALAFFLCLPDFAWAAPRRVLKSSRRVITSQPTPARVTSTLSPRPVPATPPQPVTPPATTRAPVSPPVASSGETPAPPSSGSIVKKQTLTRRTSAPRAASANASSSSSTSVPATRSDALPGTRVLTVSPTRVRRSDPITITWSIPSDQFRGDGEIKPYLCEVVAPILKECSSREKVYECLEGCTPMLANDRPLTLFSIQTSSGSITIPARAWRFFTPALEPLDTIDLKVILVLSRSIDFFLASKAGVVHSNSFTVLPTTPIIVTISPSEIHPPDRFTIRWEAPADELQVGGIGDLCLAEVGVDGCLEEWPTGKQALGSVTTTLPFALRLNPALHTKRFVARYTLQNAFLRLWIETESNPLTVIKPTAPPSEPRLPPEQGRPKDQAPMIHPSEQDPDVKTRLDPIDIHRGEFVLTRQDILLAGRGPAIDVTFTYRSRSTVDGLFGYGWDMSYHRRLQRRSDTSLVALRGDGRREVFTLSAPQTYTAPPGVYDTLVQNADGTYTLTSKHGDREIYDGNGNLIRLEDRHGNALLFTYDAAGLFPIVTAPDKVVGWDYHLARITATDGRTVDFTYTLAGRLATLRYAGPYSVTVFGFGYLETLHYAGRTITYEYDLGTGDLKQVTTPPTPEDRFGRSTRYSYSFYFYIDVDRTFKVVTDLETISDPKNETYLINYYDRTADRVTKQTYGQGTSSLVYGKDAQGNPTTEVTDRRGVKTRFIFDAAGHITKKEQFTDGNPPDEPKSYVTLYEYNAAGERTRVVFPRGNSIEFTYDAKGNLLEQRRKKIGAAKGVTDPSDLVWTFTYEPRFNLLKTATDPRGNITTYLYDYEVGEPAFGTLRKIISPSVDGKPIETTLTYNRFGQVETSADPTGLITKFTYDPSTGHLLSTIEGWGTSLAGTTRFTYDDVGNVLTTTDPNGHKTTFAYNLFNQLIKTTAPWPFGFETLYAYDANGNLFQADRQAKAVKPGPRPQLGTSKPDDDWQSTVYGYTTLDQLAAVADDLAQTTGFAYDPNGNRTKLLDAKQQPTASIYDERNLLWKTLDAATPQGVTESRYDPNGNLALIKDAKGNPATSTYDDFDRLTRTTYADGSFEEYGYDAASNLTSRRTPAGQTITYLYDPLNRLSKKITPEDTTTFTYDLAGRLLTATSATGLGGSASGGNATGTISFTYDKRGRVKTATSLGGKRLIYDYDAAGNRTQLTHPDGFTVVAFYDALHRLIGLDFGGGTEPFPYPSPSPSPDPSLTAMIQFVYDALSRRISLLLPTGLRTTYGYDAANRLLNLTITRGRNLLLSFASTYDALGNRLTSEVGSGKPEVGRTRYDYDALSQLKTVDAPPPLPDVTYTYDAAGNRLKMVEGATTTSYVPNRLNQYDTVGATTLRHDKNGNLTFSATGLGGSASGGDGTTTYAYDSENRLVTAQGSWLRAQYSYDALGRRIEKTVNGVTTRFLYDGDQLIADLDSAGKLLARYVYGPGLDEPLVMLRGGKPYSFHADALGSIIALTDNRGQVIESYRYDPFGTPTLLDPAGQVRALSIVGNRFLFTGREYDQETGLYHYRARAYSPTLGRFLQRDPLGELSEENLYRYVGNNPTSWTDPFGLVTLAPTLPLPTSRPVPGTEAGNKQRGGKPVGLQQPETGKNMAETADAAEEQAKGQGEKKGRGLDDVLNNWERFLEWLKRKFPADKPYSAQEARKIWDKLRETGLNPRLDPTSSRGRYWQGPHINAQVGGTNVHIPISSDFQP